MHRYTQYCKRARTTRPHFCNTSAHTRLRQIWCCRRTSTSLMARRSHRLCGAKGCLLSECLLDVGCANGMDSCAHVRCTSAWVSSAFSRPLHQLLANCGSDQNLQADDLPGQGLQVWAQQLVCSTHCRTRFGGGELRLAWNCDSGTTYSSDLVRKHNFKESQFH